MLAYNMMNNTFTRLIGPDDSGRAGGRMVYLPAGHDGMLVYLGGFENNTSGGRSAVSCATMGQTSADLLIRMLGADDSKQWPRLLSAINHCGPC